MSANAHAQQGLTLCWHRIRYAANILHEPESTVRVRLPEPTKHRHVEPNGRVCLAEYSAYAYIMGYVLELGIVYEQYDFSI